MNANSKAGGVGALEKTNFAWPFVHFCAQFWIVCTNDGLGRNELVRSGGSDAADLGFWSLCIFVQKSGFFAQGTAGKDGGRVGARWLRFAKGSRFVGNGVFFVQDCARFSGFSGKVFAWRSGGRRMGTIATTRSC
jgi:hypothetical protein